MQRAGEYGHDVGERLAAQPNADQIMRNLDESAKNLNKATRPRVPAAHPGAPPVMRR
jgi:hypothetical protein